MKTFSWAFAVFLALTIGCQKNDQAATTRTNQTGSSGNPLTAPVDYLGAVAQSKRVAEKTIDLAALNNAIQMFNVQEERFPKDLNELVAKRYMPSLPATPPGMQILYNSANGEVRMVKQP